MAKNRFYIYPEAFPLKIFELSTTSDATINTNSQVTSHPVPTGQDLSDNIVLDPVTISLNGRLTDVLGGETIITPELQPILTTSTDVKTYIEDLRSLLQSRQEFVIVLPTLGETKRCIITNFVLTKTPELGGEAWDVSIDAQQIKSANLSRIVPAPAEPFAVAAQSGAVGNSTVVAEDGKVVACGNAFRGTETCTIITDEKTGISTRYFIDGTTRTTGG